MEEFKGIVREKELTKDVYFSEAYFEKYQLFSLSEQISLVYKYSKQFKQPSIIEIGKGNGFVSDFFKKAKYNFMTFDINENLKPDILGNILELDKYVDFKVDIIAACEVLEHLPFDMFESSLEQISRVTKKNLIITLPEFKKFFGFNIQFRLPKLERFSTPFFLKYRGNTILGSGHYWEIDYDKNTKRKNIEMIVEKYFKIVESGKFHTNPYHNYYVLEKQ